MCLRHQPAQIEPQTDTATCPCARAVGSVEGLRQGRQLVFCHTGTEVAHTHCQLAVGLVTKEEYGRLRGQPGQDIHSRAVDILVSRLRKKLEPLDVIHTLRNAGYLFAGVRA